MTECVRILNNMLEFLHRDKKEIGPTDNDIRDITFHLLRTVIQSTVQMETDNNLIKNLVSIMLGMFKSMSDVHYTLYVNNFNSLFDLQEFLTEILLVFKNLVSRPVFPLDWKDMIMHQNSVILDSLKHFAGIIMDKFSSPFEDQVWSNFFYCSITFLIQPALRIDNSAINKHSITTARYYKIRLEAANQIHSMWMNLGDHKVKFVQKLVSLMLEMSMIPERKLRETTIPIFFDMMQCEYYSSRYVTEGYGDTKRNPSHIKGNFCDFETEMIKALDTLVEGGHGDEEFKQLFKDIMLDKCASHSTLKERGIKFVTNITNLMDRLLEYRSLINDESKENRMLCIDHLLQFYEEIDRKEMYIRYVNKLYDLHVSLENYTEAAFALKLHSDLLQWNDTKLNLLLRSGRHPNCQTHRDLKIKLYSDMISNFEKGLMWENALDLCKELANQFENVIYEYLLLSDLYELMAKYYKKIVENEERMDPVYFRVAFYGRGFSKYLRNQEFVYRQKAYEQLSDFCKYMQCQHPNTEILQFATEPGPDIKDSDKRFMQIYTVEPMLNAKYNHLISAQNRNINRKIVRYYENNNVNHFKFSRPLYDKTKGKDADKVENVSLERYMMQTQRPLPGILRWFPIIKTTLVRVDYLCDIFFLLFDLILHCF